MQTENVKDIAQALVDEGLVVSKSEARRLIVGGVVKLDGQPVHHMNQMVRPEQLYTLEVGNKRNSDK